MEFTFEPAPSPTRPEPEAVAPPLTRGRRTRVCFLAQTTWPVLAGVRDIPVIGGAELQQAVIARTLARRGYEVTMISLDYGQPEGTVIDGVRILNMHKPDEGIRVVRFVYPRLTSLWSALRRADADVYYQRTAAACTGFLAAFCRMYGRRSIYAGASDVDFLPGRQDIAFARDRWLFEYGLRRVDTVLAQNPFQQEAVRKHYGREALLIPNCFKPPEVSAPGPGGYVLWVATVRPQKRPEVLIEMARRLPQHRFVVIGGRDPGRRGEQYAESIHESAARLPNVEVKGFLPFAEADRYFAGARVVLNTSAYEGFPNTFLQAWSRGVPTLAFVDTGSRHGDEPVYDVAGDVDDAVARLDRLMSDESAWQRASRRANEHFHSRHSLDAVAGLYEAEIGRLTGVA